MSPRSCIWALICSAIAMPNEADTCRHFVVPKLQAAGWDTDPHSITEQRCFSDEVPPARAAVVVPDGTLFPAILDRAFKGDL